MAVQLPAWLELVPLQRREHARTRFLLRIAALYATEDGTMTRLSALLGLHENTLTATAGSRERISPELARSIERALGEDLFPRELLNPKIFGMDDLPFGRQL